MRNFAGGKLNLFKKCYNTLQDLEGMHMHHMANKMQHTHTDVACPQYHPCNLPADVLSV